MKLPMPAPRLAGLFQQTASTRLGAILELHLGATQDNKYHHWDTLRHLKPPGGFSPEEYWLAVKVARSSLLRPLPLIGKDGTPFRTALCDPVLASLHRLDRMAAGSLLISEAVANASTRDSYLISQLIEEAITSSQLEGAATTRHVAEQMLRAQRTPVTRDERMILNNYRAMTRIRELQTERLRPTHIREIHRVLTEGTLRDPRDSGRLRTERDEVVVEDIRDGVILHVPPSAGLLQSRLELLCRVANESEAEPFLHPVIRAILLHFWIAYDHPFVDGNGRTARALFYWSMLRQGYWLAEFLSISTVLKRAPGQYLRSYLLAESDENDMTYFVIAQLSVIEKAIEQLREVLRRRMEEVRRTETLIRKSALLNARQIALMGHAIRNPGATYAIETHKNYHNVVYQTARTDLLQLARLGYLTKRRVGRKLVFTAPPDVLARVKR